jgi:hypothetical protein
MQPISVIDSLYQTPRRRRGVELPPMSPAVLLGIVLLALYWAWIGFFFARVRPRIMDAVGRRLRVKVAESTDVLDAGTYSVEGDDAPLRKTGVVLVADLVVLLLGTVGVAALLFIPAFLIADSGALLPLEARWTGRGATLNVAVGAAMESSIGKATLGVRAENVGSEALRECVAGVDGYTARNGYLHGSSLRFELKPGQRRTVPVGLEATRPPPGEHRFRLKLECANERLAVADAVVTVR